MKYYEVYSPVYETYHGSMWSLDPPEYGADFIIVRANTKREAIVKGVRGLRKRHGQDWYNGDGDTNPYKGMKADEIDDPEYLEYLESGEEQFLYEEPSYTEALVENNLIDLDIARENYQ